MKVSRFALLWSRQDGASPKRKRDFRKSASGFRDAKYSNAQTHRKPYQSWKVIHPEDQENLVRGRLADNVVKGSDRGVMSAKALGSDKRVSMFTPEFQQGIIVLQPPNMTAEQMQKALQAPDE